MFFSFKLLFYSSRPVHKFQHVRKQAIQPAKYPARQLASQLARHPIGKLARAGTALGTAQTQLIIHNTVWHSSITKEKKRI
jgi:hypothetical protein